MILSILIVSCNQSNTKKTENPAQQTSVAEVKQKEKILPPLINVEVNLTENDFGDIIELKGTQHIVNNIFRLSDFEMIANDSILTFKTIDKDILLFYSLPDFKLKKAFGKQGRGPGEYAFPSLVKVENSNKLGYIYNDLTDELNAIENSYTINKKAIKLNNSRKYNRKQIHGLSPNHLLYVENIKRGKAVFDFKVDGDSSTTKQIYNLAFSNDYKSWAAYIGNFGANASKKRFVYAYKYFKRLVFHDLENNTSKIINFDVENLKKGSDIDILAPTNTTYYFGISAQKNYVYVLYSGRTPIQVRKDYNNGKKHTFIEQFDWNGNPIRKFKLDQGGLFCVNEAENTIFIASNLEENPFYTYKLPKL